jgi:polyisoprenoid-binding protein YceI
MKSAILCGLVLGCSAPGAWAATSTYDLNKDHTDVSFRISHAGFTLKHGEFADISGTLQLDSDHLEASSVDVSVVAASIWTNHAKRDQVLQGTDFLDGAHFPALHFVSTHVVQTAPGKLDVTGTLTLRGVSRPLVLHASVNRIGISPFGNTPAAGFTATGTLKRSDYGMDAMIPMIGDEVQIDIDAEFKRSSGT